MLTLNDLDGFTSHGEISDKQEDELIQLARKALEETQQECMEWIELEIDNLPKGEVLATNFESRTFAYKEKVLGYVYCSYDMRVSCKGENSFMENCTHYIDIHKFDLS